MKNFIFSLLISVLLPISTLYSQQNLWTKLNSPTIQPLKRVFFVDSLYGWAVGDSGTIVHTTNGGLNWTLQDSKIYSYLAEVYFKDRNNGYVLGWEFSSFYGTYILKTTNGGSSWDTSRYWQNDVYLKTIYFHDALTGYMAGFPANIMKTTDGGNTWVQCQIDSSLVSNFPVNKISFYNRQFGMACGGVMDIAGVVWVTTNYGLRWTPYILAPEPLYGIMFFDSLNILCVGGDFEYGPSFIRTSNAGANWSYRTLGIIGLATSMSFRTMAEGWVPLYSVLKFLRSTDYGVNWEEINSPDSVNVSDVFFLNDRVGFFVGDSGAIYKFNYTVGIHNKTSQFSTSFVLHQNFPNPFNSSTIISYTVPEAALIDIKLYNILGKELMTIFSGVKTSGNYSHNLNVDFLSSGVYICVMKYSSLRSPDIRGTKSIKLTVIK